MQAETQQAPDPSSLLPNLAKTADCEDLGYEEPLPEVSTASPSPSTLIWQTDPGHHLLGSPEDSKEYAEERPEPQFFSNDSGIVASESDSGPH